jgi:hypothetical protein
MNPHEQKLIRAVRILLNWARKHDGITPPFPVFHPYMSRVDGADCPRWRAPKFSSTSVTVEPFADGEVALIEIAEGLVKEDADLDPERQHDPHEVAVWTINIPSWGSTQYVATEAEAEEWRRDKARSERSAGATKRRLTGATPQELRRYKHVGPHHLE